MSNQSNLTPKFCQVDAGQALFGKPSGKVIDAYDLHTDQVPAIDPLYQFADWQADVIVWWRSLSQNHPLYIFGPAGCGKTSGLKQLAARLNYPVYEVTGYASMEPVDLQGLEGLTVNNGATESHWIYGPLAQAMREGGLFIFNEIDMASPASLVALNTILDGSPLTIESTGETIQPSPQFKFAATGNSNGSGDETGAYAGVLRQNFALQDRFIGIQADYMSRETELALLKRKAPTLAYQKLDQMIEFATVVRSASLGKAPSKFKGYNNVLLPVSTRALLRWAEVAEVYAPAEAYDVDVLEKAMLLSFASTKDKGQLLAYKELLQRITGGKE